MYFIQLSHFTSRRHAAYLLPSSIMHRQEVHHKADHGFLFFGLGGGNHDDHSDEGVVGNELFAFVVAEEKIVLPEEVEEDGGGDAFVAVGKGVVLGDEVKEVRRFFLDGGVDVFAAETLINVAEAAFEGVVFFIAEDRALRAVAHGVDEAAAFLVGQHIGCVAEARLGEALVVVIIQQVQCAAVLLHDIEDGFILRGIHGRNSGLVSL